MKTLSLAVTIMLVTVAAYAQYTEYIINDPSVLAMNKIRTLFVNNHDSSTDHCPLDYYEFDSQGRVISYGVGASDEETVYSYNIFGLINNISHIVHLNTDSIEVTQTESYCYYPDSSFRYRIVKTAGTGKTDTLVSRELKFPALKSNIKYDNGRVISHECRSFNKPCHRKYESTYRFEYHYLSNGLLHKIDIFDLVKGKLADTWYFLYNVQ